MRVLSISTLFPNPVRPSFGIFVGNQMRAVVAREEAELTMVSPIGIPPWPFSRREPYASLASIPEKSDIVGFDVHYPKFRLIPKIGGTSNPGRIVSAILPLARRLHAEQPFDLVDAQFFFPDGPAAAGVARDLGLPLTIKSRGADIHFWGKQPKALAQMLQTAQQATALLAVSEALKKDMTALGMPEDRIHVHYTGLDRDRFQPMDRGAARALISALPGLNVWSQGRLIVTPGALIERKGQQLVIEALRHLPDVHLALAGVGEDEPRLRTLARELGLTERVQFLGLVTHDHLPKLLSAADAVVLPSASEGLANAWVEALACGTPIVIPDIGGAREILKDPTAGRIVERNPVAIAVAVRELIDNLPSQESVASNASQFSWGVNATNLIRFWRQALAD